MNVAALALKHSRAVGLLAVALVVSGAIAAFTLPSGIYPPLQFPRIVVVAHSGTLPPQSTSLIVTRPIEQAIMAVPGIRRVRSKSLRGAAEISAQFDPATDMVVALQIVQNRIAAISGHLPAGTALQIERMTPEIFPVCILSLTGALATADLYDVASVVVKPEIARVAGAGVIGRVVRRRRAGAPGRSRRATRGRTPPGQARPDGSTGGRPRPRSPRGLSRRWASALSQ